MFIYNYVLEILILRNSILKRKLKLKTTPPENMARKKIEPHFSTSHLNISLQRQLALYLQIYNI